MTMKRVAIVGTGARGVTFLNAIIARPSVELVFICDTNNLRSEYYNQILQKNGRKKAAFCQPTEFSQQLKQQKIDTAIVTCVDALHHVYILQCLDAGVNVITEKPMTTTAENCKLINSAANKPDASSVTVAFNYRYNPAHEKVKHLLASNKIGNILSVHFEWLLDTVHGADYFRRWHRYVDSSGSLMVHKSGHHFDLVNWWLDSAPVQVAGMGKLCFYGDKAGKKHGWAKDYERARNNPEASNDPFAIDLENDQTLKSLYADTEHADGYHRDQNVFAPGITIQDDMSVLVKYDSGATMTYHLTAYSPWEGYRVMFNGSHGRLELEVVEKQFCLPPQETKEKYGIHGKQADQNAGGVKLTLHPLWKEAEKIPVDGYEHTDHGGGDKRMLNQIFGPIPGQENVKDSGGATKRSASFVDGTLALAVGLAAMKSFETNSFVDVSELDLGI